MVSFEEILKNAKIERNKKEYPRVGTIEVKEQEICDTIKNNKDLNDALEFLNIGKIESVNPEDETLVLSCIQKIYQEIQKIFPENEELTKRLCEMEEVIKNNENIIFLDKCERECDILEISLANLKVKYDEANELNSVNLLELEKEFSDLNQNFNDNQLEIRYKDLLARAFRFIEGEAIDRETLDIFQFIKEKKEYRNVVEKEKLLEGIYNSGNSHMVQIFKKLIEYEELNIEDLQRNIEIDRIELLKIIYSLLNKDIISVDKDGGFIRLNK